MLSPRRRLKSNTYVSPSRVTIIFSTCDTHHYVSSHINRKWSPFTRVNLSLTIIRYRNYIDRNWFVSGHQICLTKKNSCIQEVLLNLPELQFGLFPKIIRIVTYIIAYICVTQNINNYTSCLRIYIETRARCGAHGYMLFTLSINTFIKVKLPFHATRNFPFQQRNTSEFYVNIIQALIEKITRPFCNLERKIDLVYIMYLHRSITTEWHGYGDLLHV